MFAVLVSTLVTFVKSATPLTLIPGILDIKIQNCANAQTSNVKFNMTEGNGLILVFMSAK